MMNRLLSVLIITALLVPSATAGAQTSAPAVARTNEYWIRYAERLPIGSTVRLRTRDGQRLTAILAIVDSTGITLEARTRIPEPPRYVAFGELDQLELKEKGSSIGKAVAIGAASGAATFLGIFLILMATLD